MIQLDLLGDTTQKARRREPKRLYERVLTLRRDGHEVYRAGQSIKVVSPFGHSRLLSPGELMALRWKGRRPMKIIVTSTTKVITLNGVPVRIWEGHTDSGIPVFCYITRIACPEGADLSQFNAELEVCAEPSPAIAPIPLRMVL